MGIAYEGGGRVSLMTVTTIIVVLSLVGLATVVASMGPAGLALFALGGIAALLLDSAAGRTRWR